MEVNDLRNKYSKKEKIEILKEFRESNLSVIKFAKEKCIPTSTIFTWLKREKESKQVTEEALSQKNENTLVEIVVLKKNERNIKEKNTESKQTLVLACNGCAIQISDDFNQATLKRVLQVVQEL